MGITTTAEVMEMARDIRRKWGDLHLEIFVWEDGVKLVENRLYYFQAIHQESDVIPENIDCIRALVRLNPIGKFHGCKNRYCNRRLLRSLIMHQSVFLT